MTQPPATDVHTRQRGRREHNAPLCSETHEVRYLDLSGDGVLDAVEHIDRRSFRRNGIDEMEVRRRLSYGIGINGEPAGVTERTTVFVRDETGVFVRDETGRLQEAARAFVDRSNQTSPRGYGEKRHARL